MARGQDPDPSQAPAAAPAETDIVDLDPGHSPQGPGRSATAGVGLSPADAGRCCRRSVPSRPPASPSARSPTWRSTAAIRQPRASRRRRWGRRSPAASRCRCRPGCTCSRAENRFNIQGDNRFLWTSQDTFGLGPDTAPEDAVNVRFDHFRISDIGYLAIRPRVYAGIGPHFNVHRNVEPGEDADAAWESSPYVEYSRRNGLPEDSQTSSGLTMGLLVDTRDNVINARQGWAGVADLPALSSRRSAAIRRGRSCCSMPGPTGR